MSRLTTAPTITGGTVAYESKIVAGILALLASSKTKDQALSNLAVAVSAWCDSRADEWKAKHFEARRGREARPSTTAPRQGTEEKPYELG